jgi:hypothetical protein
MTHPFLINKIDHNPIEDMCNDINIELEESPYELNGVKVPRVTSILSNMLHEESLVEWANFIGRVKHCSHNVYSQAAANIGTYVHDAIEKYIQEGICDNFEQATPESDRPKMRNAFNAFLKWWNIITLNNYEVLMEEQALICPYCGGKLDLLLRINGRIYLVDFKTSNSLHYNYYLQLAAYRRMLYELYGILIDGTILLKLNKANPSFDEVLLDFTNYEHLQFINNCDRCFLSLVYAYHNRQIVQNTIPV